MLRRTVMLAVASVLALSLLACNFSSTFALISAARSLFKASPFAALAETAGDAAPAETAWATIPSSPTVASSLQIELTPTVGARSPILQMPAGAMTQTVGPSVPQPTVVIPPRDTPSPGGQATEPSLNPTAAIKLPAETPARSASPKPTAFPRPTATMLVALPTSFPESTPAQTETVGTIPEIVWLQDRPASGQSKLMGWANDTSYPISISGKTNIFPLIADVSVSPDGMWVAYNLVSSPFIFEVNTINGQTRKIVPPQPGWRFRSAEWSRTGERLSFIGEFVPFPGAPPTNVGLWTSKPDGKDLRRIVRGGGLFGQWIPFADWHPNGKDLVYALTGPYGWGLPQWLTIPDGGGKPQHLPLTGWLYDIAPDGSWLLGKGFPRTSLAGRREYNHNALLRIPMDGTTPTVLTPACRSDTEGRISPDGTRIALLSRPSLAPTCPRVSGPRRYELWVMNNDGTGRHQIDVNGVIGPDSPQWSADGAYIYYSLQGTNGPELWRADAGGTKPPVRLSNTTGVSRFRVVR